MAISASVAIQGVNVAENYTLRMTAGDDACPMPEGKLGGTCDMVVSRGLATFPVMRFTEPGNYLYRISQLPGSNAMALRYDDAVYDLRVQVREADSGLQLTAIMNREGSDKKAASADFTNAYIAPAVVEHNPPVKKAVTGSAAPNASFSFALTPISNTAGLSAMPMPEGSVNGVKTVTTTAGVDKEFGTMTFEAPGEYVYRVAEVNDGQNGFTYDTAVYTLTYTVARQGDALTCALRTTKDGAEAQSLAFTNAYSGGGTPATAAPTATATAAPTQKPSSGGGGGGGSAPASTPRPTAEITGTKVWVDGGNVHRVRPSGITIHLFADGTEVDATSTWTKSGNVWTYSFGKLPSVDEAGRSISYTVTEDGVPYYATSISGMTITNTLEDRSPSGYTDVSGTKTWNDDGTGRPAYITVRLLRDGEPVDQRTVTAAAGWSYSFDRLPLDDGYGHSYAYAVREDGVQGYFARYNGFNVTNTRLVKRPLAEEAPDANEPPEEGIEESNTGTPAPRFSLLTDEELEKLLDLWGYRSPSSGMLLATGDEIPWWVFAACGAGILAIALLLATRKRKR